MLIFGGFHRFRRYLVALDLADNGKRVNISFFRAGHVGAQVNDLTALLFFQVRVFLRFHFIASFFHRITKRKQSIPYCKSFKMRI